MCAAPVFKTLYLMITRDCNLRCRYCYNKHEHLSMSVETADSIIDTLDKDVQYSLLFIGGEPFLNFPVLKHITERMMREHTIKNITIGTNGTIYNDDIVHYLKKHRSMLDFHVSWDLSRGMHDRDRVFWTTGKGSYDIVRKNLRKYLAAVPELLVEARFRAGDAKDALEGFHDAESLGVQRMKFSSVGFVGEDNHAQSEDFAALFDAYLNDFVLQGKRLLISTFFSFDTWSGEKLPCGAGTGGQCYDERGDVYPCYLFATARLQRIGKEMRIDPKKFALFMHKMEKYNERTFSAHDRKCLAYELMNKKSGEEDEGLTPESSDGMYLRLAYEAIQGREGQVHPELLEMLKHSWKRYEQFTKDSSAC